MFNAIWEGCLNDRYSTRVVAHSEWNATLEVWTEGERVFAQDIKLSISSKVGVSDEDIQRWKQIVEDFADESKFSLN